MCGKARLFRTAAATDPLERKKEAPSGASVVIIFSERSISNDHRLRGHHRRRGHRHCRRYRHYPRNLYPMRVCEATEQKPRLG